MAGVVEAAEAGAVTPAEVVLEAGAGAPVVGNLFVSIVTKKYY